MHALKPLTVAAALLLVAGCVAPTSETAPPVNASRSAEAPNPAVGGAAMDAAAPFAANVAKSAEHGSLLAAVRAAGLDSTLAGAGPFTLFAPTDDAFRRLPKGTMDTLADPSNKWLLGRLVKYHVVLGAKNRAQIAADARAGGGAATYRTLEGGTIRLWVIGDRITVADVHGNRTEVAIADVRNSNGVMHVLNEVLFPST